MISAGIGITPVAATIDHLAAEQPGRPVLAVHADRSPRTHALRRQIAEAGARTTDFRQLTWYEDPDGTTDARPGRIDVARRPSGARWRPPIELHWNGSLKRIECVIGREPSSTRF
ncbi:hypothetical protein [Actinomadura verrucosospora]